MSKTKEELEALKVECKSLKDKLKDLTEDEFKQVVAGNTILPNDDFWGAYNPYFYLRTENKDNKTDK